MSLKHRKKISYRTMKPWTFLEIKTRSDSIQEGRLLAHETFVGNDSVQKSTRNMKNVY